MKTAEQFLHAYHAAVPAATPTLFGTGACAGFPSTYAWLAHALLSTLPSTSRTVTVLDIGCGDGHLYRVATARRAHGSTSTMPLLHWLGIDLSPAEIARASALSPSAAWSVGDAAELPLPDASADAVVSHFGLSVMQRLPEALAQALRVTRRGGRLWAIIGGGPAVGSAYEDFCDAMNASAPGAPALGTRAGRDPAALAALLAQLGWSNPRTLSTYVQWPALPRPRDFAAAHYEWSSLPAAVQNQLLAQFEPAMRTAGSVERPWRALVHLVSARAG